MAAKAFSWDSLIPSSVMLPPSNIKRLAGNPRTIKPAKMKALKASISRRGLVQNFVLWKKDNSLLGGEQRFTALEELSAEAGVSMPALVPCVILDVTEAEAIEINLALNKIGGDFDAYKLGRFIAKIRKLTPVVVEATGFTMVEAQRAIAVITPARPVIEQGSAEDVRDFGRSITMSIVCKTITQRDTARDLLKELVTRTGEFAGRIVLIALQAYSIEHPEKAKAKKKAS